MLSLRTKTTKRKQAPPSPMRALPETREIAEAIRQAAAAKNDIRGIAEELMGVHVDAPAANADVINAGLAFSTALWWLAACGMNPRSHEAIRLAGRVMLELLTLVPTGEAQW